MPTRNRFVTLLHAELLWLCRQRSGMTMPKFARHLRVSEDVLRSWEKGRVPLDSHALAHAKKILPYELWEGEWLRILRRRSERSLTEVAQLMGRSRVYVNNAEFERWKGATRELARWWITWGFHTYEEGRGQSRMRCGAWAAEWPL